MTDLGMVEMLLTTVSVNDEGAETVTVTPAEARLGAVLLSLISTAYEVVTFGVATGLQIVVEDRVWVTLGAIPGGWSYHEQWIGRITGFSVAKSPGCTPASSCEDWPAAILLGVAVANTAMFPDIPQPETASNKGRLRPINMLCRVRFITHPLLPSADIRGEGNEALHESSRGTEGVLVQAQPTTRDLDILDRVHERTAVAGKSGGVHSRAVDGVASTVGGSLRAGTYRACAAGGLPGAGAAGKLDAADTQRARGAGGLAGTLDLHMCVRDRPGATPHDRRRRQAERFVRADEGGDVVRRREATIGRAVGDCHFPLAAPSFGHEQITHLESDAAGVTAGICRRDGGWAELDAWGNNERRRVTVGGDDLGRHAAHGDAHVVRTKSLAGDCHLSADAGARRRDTLNLASLGRGLRVGSRGQRRCPGKRRRGEHNGKTLVDWSYR